LERKNTICSRKIFKKKKQKKHVPIVQVLRASSLTITKAYLTKNPAKICHIRVDTLGQILSFSNVQANSKVLLYDESDGLVLGSILEHLQDMGTVINFYANKLQNSIVRTFNFPAKIKKIVQDYPLSQINEDRVKLAASGCDCMIIVTKNDPLPILKALYNFLSGSGSFAIFHLYQQTLVECYSWLYHKAGSTRLQLSETWCRYYQILPGRTHPTMSMHGASGFILNGTKVLKEIPTSLTWESTTTSEQQESKNKRQKLDPNKDKEQTKKEKQPTDEDQEDLSEDSDESIED